MKRIGYVVIFFLLFHSLLNSQTKKIPEKFSGIQVLHTDYRFSSFFTILLPLSLMMQARYVPATVPLRWI